MGAILYFGIDTYCQLNMAVILVQGIYNYDGTLVTLGGSLVKDSIVEIRSVVGSPPERVTG